MCAFFFIEIVSLENKKTKINNKKIKIFKHFSARDARLQICISFCQSGLVTLKLWAKEKTYIVLKHASDYILK